MKRPSVNRPQPRGSGRRPKPFEMVRLAADKTIESRIKDMVRREIDEYMPDTEQKLAVLDAFRAAFDEPYEITVNFPGGTTQRCWSITKSDGDYRVIYIPQTGLFSLCVESDIGPLDIGVHGPALSCFASV